nr:RNA-directed DNA polymerase, eukaryota [Tanacetum cinerariifolium]
MGDFNEVLSSVERFCSTFHALNAAELKAFISNNQLVDVPLGGYSFTWFEKYASKMSKLDRFLVSQGLLDLFPNLTDLRLDKGESLPNDLLKGYNILHDISVMDRKSSVDLAQKAKVKWTIEGDENSKFFHGIINKRQRYLAIKGILVDGEWIDDPTRVKSEF